MSRKALEVPNIGTNKFLKVTPNLFTPERLNLFDDVEPVSYTHLDVYKRQPRDFEDA